MEAQSAERSSRDGASDPGSGYHPGSLRHTLIPRYVSNRHLDARAFAKLQRSCGRIIEAQPPGCKRQSKNPGQLQRTQHQTRGRERAAFGMNWPVLILFQGLFVLQGCCSRPKRLAEEPAQEPTETPLTAHLPRRSASGSGCSCRQPGHPAEPYRTAPWRTAPCPVHRRRAPAAPFSGGPAIPAGTHLLGRSAGRSAGGFAAQVSHRKSPALPYRKYFIEGS